MRIPLLLIIIFLCITCSAQNGAITGVVKNSKAQPVEFAKVGLKGTDRGATTDSKGIFKIDNVPPGNYVLLVSYTGFETVGRNIEVSAGETLSLPEIRLKEAAATLGEVEISGKSKTQEIKEGAYSVNAIDAKQYANTTVDVNQVLNRSTGIRVREEGGLGSTFNFSINGLSGRQVKFFTDGIPMESFGSALSLNNVPANLIQRIEVYKGVVPVALGADALGGAVNVITKQSPDKYIDLSYSGGSFNTHRVALLGRYTHSKTGFTINAAGFFNYSDNNYLMKQVEVVINNQFVRRDVRRFHDRYLSYMVQGEVGVVNKKWADALLFGFQYAAQYKQLQTGVNQEAVIGNANVRDNYIMPTVKYRKDNLFVKGLSLNLFAAYASDQSVVTDTSSNIYSWDGSILANGFYTGEINGVKTLYHYTNTFGMARINLGYEINGVHSLNLNFITSDAQRKGYNEFNPDDTMDVFAEPNKLGKRILGIAYRANLFKQKFSIIVSLKYYNFNAATRKRVFYTGTGVAINRAEKKYNLPGGGIAMRYKIIEALGIKASYEHTYRLPEAEEMFGDGRFVLGNVNLKPESSDNINAGAYFFKQIKKHTVSAEASWFYRMASDFIYFIPGVKYSSYQNAGSVLVNGIDGEVKYEYSDIFSIAVNISYQDAINNARYFANSTQVDVTYKDRLPNQPYLFGNAEIGLGKSNLLGKNTRIQFGWLTQYVEEFYLTWPSLGSQSSKNIIPRQVIQNASITYSIKNGIYNFSFEVKNLTNALVYDNFRLQKPGVGFYGKFRYFIGFK